MARLVLLAVVGLALAGCRSPATGESSMLDREFESYRGDREERRLDDLKVRTGKAQAEADRLSAELKRLEAEVRDRRARVADAAARALRLPPPLRVVDATSPPPAK